MHPFCRLLLKAVRVDSPPFDEHGRIKQLLSKRRSEANLTQEKLAENLGICKKTLWNWEAGLTKPSQSLWAKIRGDGSNKTARYSISNLVKTHLFGNENATYASPYSSWRPSLFPVEAMTTNCRPLME